MNRTGARSTLFASLFLVSTLGSGLAFAEGSKLSEWCEKRVKAGLLVPLAKKERERPRFSRGMPGPAERRVRALRSELMRDEKGRGFLPFVVDARYGDEWTESETGCVYEGTGAIYIAFGDEFRPAEFLLGKKAEPAPGVCVAAPSKS